ncbi:hypothetical protein [Mesorhizobium sp. M1163]|uniref:hypothetical protein n=1 Tax=Mesorhizobium sp. M1163 TaxID=2957065 RepID=UPI00333BE07E
MTADDAPAWVKAVRNDVQSILTYVYYLQYVGIGWLAFYGVVVLSAQTYRYLREAIWVPFSVAELVLRLDIFDMSNWLGLYAVLNQIPASTAFFVLALVWAGVWSLVAWRRELLRLRSGAI